MIKANILRPLDGKKRGRSIVISTCTYVLRTIVETNHPIDHFLGVVQQWEEAIWNRNQESHDREVM